MFNLTIYEQQNQKVAILSFKGNLDRYSYLNLIQEVRNLYKSGHRKLVLDMSGIQDICLAGFFALYSAAMLFNGDSPLDPVGGLKALYTMANKVISYSTHHFKLVQPLPKVEQALSRSGLPVYDDLNAALTSFKSKRELPSTQDSGFVPAEQTRIRL